MRKAGFTEPAKTIISLASAVDGQRIGASQAHDEMANAWLQPNHQTFFAATSLL